MDTHGEKLGLPLAKTVRRRRPFPQDGWVQCLDLVCCIRSGT